MFIFVFRCAASLEYRLDEGGPLSRILQGYVPDWFAPGVVDGLFGHHDSRTAERNDCC